MRNCGRVCLVIAALLPAGAVSAQQTVQLSSTTSREVWRGETTGSASGFFLDRGEVGTGDNRRDLIVGAPGWGTDRGRVYVIFSGPVHGGERPLANADVIVTGGVPGDRFGSATAAGWITTRELDLPQQLRDLVIAAPNANAGAGAIYVFRRGLISGQRLTPADAILTVTGAPGDHLGSALATGDMDGDGYREIIAGAPGNSRVYVIKGGPTISGTINLATQSALVRFDGAAGAGIGSVLAAGDVTGDLVYDVAIGAPDLAPAGAVYLVKGRPAGGFPATLTLASSADAVFTGIDAGDRAGAAIAIGPFDSTSSCPVIPTTTMAEQCIADLIIGAPNGNGSGNAAPASGEVYAIWGSRTLASRALSAADLTIYGLAGSHTGAALAMGDIDRSPPLDLAMLAPGGSNGLGDIMVLLGRPRTSFPPNQVWNLSGGWDRRLAADPAVGPIQSVLVYDHTGEGAEDVLAGIPSTAEGLVYISFSPLPEAILAYPAPGQAVGGTSLPFSWVAAANGEMYRITLGTAAGASNLFDSGEFLATSFPMPASLPVSQTIFARLWTRVAGIWRFKDSTFSLLPGASFIFPTNNVSGVRPSFFSWSTVSGTTVYELQVGSAPGMNDIIDSGPMAAATYFVFSLPPARTLFAQVIATTAGASSTTSISFTTAPTFTGTSADAPGFGIGTNFGAAPGGDAFLYNPTTGAWSMQFTDASGFTGVNSSLWAKGWTVQAGDFNGDGLEDLFLYNPATGQWFKVINLGGGNFDYFGGVWAKNWSVTILDFNGDGRSDVFLYNKSTGQWFQCLTIGPGDFAYTTGMWAPGWSIFPADFNGDGRADLFLYNQNPLSTDPNSGRWFRVLTNPDLSFTYLPGEVRWANYWTVTVADFNGDGQSDLFLYDPAGGHYFRVLWVNGVTQYDGGLWGANWTIVKADFNGDGLSDLFLYNKANGRWFVVITERNGSLSYYGGLWAANWQITPTDFNSDGRADLVLYNSTTGQWFQAITVGNGNFAFNTGNWGTAWSVVAGRTILP
jgi:VCBS repeat protein/FG-GAP repeat protein